MEVMPEGEPVTIRAEEVTESPGPYAMSFGFDLAKMIRSLARVGLLNRPIIERDAEGRIHVVAGYRRLMALKALHQKESRCLDLSRSLLPPLDKLLMALHENLATREFNEVEKGMVLERLIGLVPRQEVVISYMPMLGLPSREPLLEDYLRLGTLETHVKLALAEKRVSLRTARFLAELDCSSRSALFEWLSTIHFNFNQQAHLLEFISDICIRETISVSQVLSDAKISAILKNRELNQPQKIKAALDLLRERRLPTVSHAEKIFRNRVRALGLPPGSTISHSPGFEAPEYRLEIRFREGEALRETLVEIAGHRSLQDLRDPWKGLP